VTVRPRRALLNPELKRPSALASVPRDPKALWLDKNENLDPVLLARAHEVLSEMAALNAATYPEAGAVYRKLGAWAGVAPESLILTHGSDGAIRLAFEAFVEHGETVVHSSPTFAMYPVYCQMFGAKAVAIEYQRKGDEPFLDVDAFITAIKKHAPKLACLPNPDSPTGTIVSPDGLKRILGACEDSGTAFLLDEAYHPFHAWTAVEWTKTSRHLIVARTFAKAWGAAGLRIGYAVAHPETIALFHKMRPMYEVSTVAVEFMSRMLDKPADMDASVARIKDGKAHFIERMKGLGFTVMPTDGNFMHVAFGAKGPAIHAALAGKVLYRAAFDHPSLAGYTRFSVAPRDIMSKVAGMIEKAAE
jgi:histidinol-phosphate aminotransferase